MASQQSPGAGPPGNALAASEVGPLARLGDMLAEYKEQIAMAIPKHLTPERMIRIALTAVSRSELLQKCDLRTIVGCVIQASQLGLECDGALGEGYLVPFWNWKANNKRGGYECQFMPGYQGLIKLVRNTKELVMIDAQEVREKDQFEYESGLDPHLRHVVDPKLEDRGAITHYWAAALLKDGGRQFAVMTVREIEEHRDRYSKGAFETEVVPDGRGGKRKVFKTDKDGKRVLQGAWLDSPEWMFKKTVLRKLIKLLPKSAEAALAVTLDESHEVGIPQRFTVDVPIELNQTGADDDADDVADRMRNATEAGASELKDRLEKQSTSKRKKDPPADPQAEAPGTSPETATTQQQEVPPVNGKDSEVDASAEESVPEEWPTFKGEAQATVVKDMPSTEQITEVFNLGREAGVKPTKEANRLYGVNPDELSKPAMAHFVGYLKWLISRKQSGEGTGSAEASTA